MAPSFRWVHGLCAVPSFFFCLLHPGAALAQVPETPSEFAFGASACPAPKTVSIAVLGLIPPDRQQVLQHEVRIELEDLGDSYQVRVSNDSTSAATRYSDPARNCEARARFAAVFSVLTIMPPELGLESVSVPESAPEVRPAVPDVVPSSPPRSAPTPLRSAPVARVELGALYSFAPPMFRAPPLNAAGAELGIALGGGSLSGLVSFAYTSAASFELKGVHAYLSRVPASAGLRLRTKFETWELQGELSLLAVAQRVRATNLLTVNAQSSVDFGLRVAFGVAGGDQAAWAPFLRAFADISPIPKELVALPQGSVGNLPYVWLGAIAGVSLGL